MKAYTLRFHAYAAALGLPAEKVEAGVDFINRVGRQWAEFNAQTPYQKGQHHDAFDQWLCSKFGVEA